MKVEKIQEILSEKNGRDLTIIISNYLESPTAIYDS